MSSSPTTASTTTALPWPLILLVHLHILGYPNVNASEYDGDMFNHRCRGLRERVKLMEDITYFLVGNIEGKGVKMILSSYPCRTPSESLAYRTSLSKYLEHIRHQAMYPPSPPSGSQHEDMPGFWWKAVVVRKSLLEEAVGEKFERLIVSLSTHALARKIPDSLPLSSTIFQPAAYMRSLSDAQSQFQAWTRSASLISRRERNLHTLRRKLNSGACQTNAFKLLSTDRLLVLVEARLSDLLKTLWPGKIGEASILFLKELLGLVAPQTSEHPRMELPAEGKSVAMTNFTSSLPSAAARHQPCLKKLKQSPFNTISSSKQLAEGARSQQPGKTHAEIAFGAYIEDKKRVERALNDALQLCKARISESRPRLYSKPLRDYTSVPDSFWVSRRPLSEIDFNPLPSEQLLQETGFGRMHKLLGTESNVRMEARIRQIRSQVLPSFTSDLPRTSPQHPPPGVIQQPQTDASLATVPSTPANVSSGTAQPAQIPSTKPSGSAGPRSVRFSTASRRSCGPSIFGTFIQDHIDAEVDLLIDETNDLSSDDKDAAGESDPCGSSSSCTTLSTPRARRKTPRVNRIWTAGTPVSKKRNSPFVPGEPDTTPKPRQSSIALAELFESDEPPLMRLPSFGSSPSFSVDDSSGDLVRWISDGSPDDASTSLGSGFLNSGTFANGRRSSRRQPRIPEEDCSFEDEPSMTLKEILLSADAGGFDLLEDDEIQGDLSRDESFAWE